VKRRIVAEAQKVISTNNQSKAIKRRRERIGK
jgi:hypothetical protein